MITDADPMSTRRRRHVQICYMISEHARRCSRQSSAAHLNICRADQYPRKPTARVRATISPVHELRVLFQFSFPIIIIVVVIIIGYRSTLAND